MFISNWLSALVSRIRRRPRYNSRARRAIRKRWQAIQQNRLTTIDQLEDRTLLTAQIIDIDGTAGADDFQVLMNADGVTLEVWNGASLAFSDLLTEVAELNINGGAGADTFTVDISNGLPFPLGTINFDGEVDGGSIVLESGSYAGSLTTVAHTLSSNTAGSVTIDGQIINYTGTDSLADNLETTSRSFNYTGAGETITLTDTGTSNDGLSSINSTLGAAVTFVSTADVTISTTTGSGVDLINVQGLDSLNAGSLTVTGDANDNVTFQTNNTTMGANDLTVSAHTITVDSGVSSTTGVISLTASRNILLDNGSSLTTVDGGITLLANNGGTTSGEFAGIESSNATLETTGMGDISITGFGGNGSGANNYGINLVSTDLLSSSTDVNAGAITVNGSGGAGTQWTSGLRFNNGTLSSIEGDITLIGQGGSGSQSESDGVILGNTTVTIVNGNLDIDGQAGGTSGSSTNIGFTMKIGSQITSTGTGAITISGTGGSGTSTNFGIHINNSGIESSSGDIELTGQGGNGSSIDNFGLFLQVATIASTGTGVDAASITLEGTGGSGTNSARGLVLSEGVVTSIDGDISLTGQGGSGTTSENYGVNLLDSDLVSTGIGTITIDGTGGISGTTYNRGIFTNGTDITTAYGDISLFGQGGGNGSNNQSIVLGDSTVKSTDGGGIVLDATGDINLSGVNTSGHVYVHSSAGSVLDNGDNHVDIIAGTAAINAAGTIGTAANPIDTWMDFFTSNSGVGDTNISNRELFYINDITATENGSFVFTVSLSRATTANVTVRASTVVGTAGTGDFTAISNQLVTIPAGQTSANVTVNITNDSLVEGTENFTVVLSDPKYNGNPNYSKVVIGDDTGIGTIVHNDSASLSINDVTVDEDAGTATLTVTLNNNVDTGFTVDYSAQDNTATAGTDYTLAAGQLTFAGTAGETQTITVTINDNTTVEALESLFVNLDGINIAGNRNVTLADSQGQVSITDNESATLSIGDLTVDEDAGTATFTVTLDQDVQDGVSFDWSTADGTATAGIDYTAGSGTLNFTGSTSETQTITVTLNDDLDVEADETFLINLSNLIVGGNVTLAQTQATATITDDDSITINGTAAADDFLLQLNADGVTLEVWNDVTLVYSGLLTDYTEININGGAGVDTLIVDLSNGLPFPLANINFDGETDGGYLVLESGSYAGSLTTVTHTLGSNSAGSISIDGQFINYTGADAIADNLVATNRVFDFLGAAETITLSDSGTSNDGLSSIDSTLGAAVTFISTTAVTVSTTSGSGADLINIQGLDSLTAGNFTVTGDANDNATFQTNNTEMGVNDLTVTAQTITVDSAVSSTDGAISLNMTGT